MEIKNIAGGDFESVLSIMLELSSLTFLDALITSFVLKKMNDFTYINAREITRKENKENERQPIYVFSKREYVIECWN